MISNQFEKKGFMRWVESLEVFILIQVGLGILYIIIANIISYPLDFENDFTLLSELALIFFLTRTLHAILVGYKWGKYPINITFFSFSRPFFVYGLIILIFVVLSQIFVPNVTGILLWPVSGFLLIDVDTYVVYLFFLQKFDPSSQGDAAILAMLILLIYGMIFLIPYVFVCFFGGIILNKLIRKQRKNGLDPQKDQYFINELDNLKYFFLFLAILGTLILLSLDLSRATILGLEISLPEIVFFLIYESIGLSGLIIVYYLIKRQNRKRIPS